MTKNGQCRAKPMMQLQKNSFLLLSQLLGREGHELVVSYKILYQKTPLTQSDFFICNL